MQDMNGYVGCKSGQTFYLRKFYEMKKIMMSLPCIIKKYQTRLYHKMRAEIPYKF